MFLRSRLRHGGTAECGARKPDVSQPLSRSITPTLARTWTRLGSLSSSGRSLVKWIEGGEVACDQALKPFDETPSACILLSQSEYALSTTTLA